jgi:hypothetical protein
VNRVPSCSQGTSDTRHSKNEKEGPNHRRRKELGFEPRITLEKGLVKLAEWLAGQVPIGRVMEASAELSSRGLAI